MKKFFEKAISAFLKPLLVLCMFVLVCKQQKAQVCSNPGSVIYSLSNAGVIYPVTVSTASVGAVVNPVSLGATTSANGIGYNPLNGLFYYFQNANNGASQQFVSYNPSTNTYTILAQAPITATVYKGCVSFNGKGYYCIDANGNLCYYNIPTNTWVLACSNFKDQFGNNINTILTSEASGDLAIDGLGNMWIVTSSTTKWGLYMVSAPLPTTNMANLTAQQLIAPTTATPGGTNFVGIAFDALGNIYMGTNNDLYLLKTNFTLSHIAAFSIAGICGDLTSCNFPFTLLDMTFQNLSIVALGNKSVFVSWSVSDQTYAKGFNIERSLDGTNWSQLGFVATNTMSQVNELYNFMDNNPLNGLAYYRIYGINADGKNIYSETMTVSIQGAPDTYVHVWPNPAKEELQIQNKFNYTNARIYGQSGTLLSQRKLQSGINTINVSSLPFGVYVMILTDANGLHYNLKFMKE